MWLILGAAGLAGAAAYFAENNGCCDSGTGASVANPTASPVGAGPSSVASTAQNYTCDPFIAAFAAAIAKAEGYGACATNLPTSSNNPGDLDTSQGWLGIIGSKISSGPRATAIAIFDSFADGVRALVLNLTAHVAKNGNETLASYLASYGGDNPAIVLQSLGLGNLNPNTTTLSQLQAAYNAQNCCSAG